MTGMVGQLRVEDAIDGGVTDQQVDDRPRVLAVPIHPHAQRLDTAQHEVAVERRGHGAGRVLGEPQPLGQLVVVDRQEPADHVAVTAEVLGGRVHDDVGAERDRLLQVRSGERVVDHHQRAAARGRVSAIASMSKHVSSGLVGVSSHTIPVSAGQSAASASRSPRSTAAHGNPSGDHTFEISRNVPP